MPEQIYIGNFAKGLTTSRLPFVIDNDAFPTMFNFYSWRGRAKRKRGTILLGQLQLQVQSVTNATPPKNWQIGQIFTLSGAGAGSFNLISTTITNITQATKAVVTLTNIIFSQGDMITFSGVVGMTQINGKTGTVVSVNAAGSTVTVNIDSTGFTAYGSAGVAALADFFGITPGTIMLSDGTNTYAEPAPPDGTLVGTPAGTGTINYATGAVTITGGAAAGVITGTFSYYPGLPVMGLRDFSYKGTPSVPAVSLIYPQLLAFDTVNAYQILQTSAAQNFFNVSYYKGSNNPVYWTGQDYQQFWTTNYQSALWATNNNPGMQFENISAITKANPTVITTAAAHGLITGDYVWFNEITGADAGTLNGQTAQITKTGANTFTVAINTMGLTINNNGIFQTLTAISPTSTGDGIRWYDGDPTSTTGLPTTTALGWVNFAPPLTAGTVSIDDETAAKYYLVGALAILPFKDRLLFFSPWIQTSTGNPIQLQDTVLWSWNGTPYYSSLTPFGETSSLTAYYQDQTGLGGNLPAGTAEPIATVTNNEDVLIIGFGGKGRKTRFVYTNNDLQPFLFYNINSELPSDCTYSAITLDKGAIDIGAYGIAMTDQQSSSRIDLDIPDFVFQIQAQNNGVQRVNAARDFYREWIYFSYPVNTSAWKFPTQTFLFNYRDNTWGIQYENFTTHGTYRPMLKKSWLTLGFQSWNAWREPWNSGANSPSFPSIIAGNPQGYVLTKGQGTGESVSGSIQSIAASAGNTQITSENHCVQVGDYLYISGCLGTTAINGNIGMVISTSDANTLVIDLPFPAGTYLGLGQFTRLSQPLLQTKQFPVYWDQGRQTRLSAQKYLMDYTASAQVTVNVYLSQDPDDVWNTPQPPFATSALVYTQILFTCPEGTNIGLTPANTNLQMPTAQGQYQIWHRFNTSLIGDSVQIGITLSDAQMRNLTYATSEITLQGMHLVVERGPQLC